MARSGWSLTLFEWEQGGTHEAYSDCSMDPALWSSLPEDILLQVVTKLPVKSFLRFMAVCKRWRTTLSRPGLLKQPKCVGSLSKEPGPADTVALCALEKLGLQMVRVHKFHLSAPLDGLKFGGSCRGLLCFYSLQRERHLQLFLCNPLRGTWEELTEVQLPPYPRKEPQIIMKGDRIYVVKMRYVRVYSLKSGRWKAPAEQWYVVEKFSQPVVCNSVIYQLSQDGVLHALDVKKDTESRTHILSEMEHAWLVEHDGCVYVIDKLDLVAGADDPDTLEVRSVTSDTKLEHWSCAPEEQWRPFEDFLTSALAEANFMASLHVEERGTHHLRPVSLHSRVDTQSSCGVRGLSRVASCC